MRKKSSKQGPSIWRELIERLRGMRPLRILAWVSLPFFPLFCLFVMDYMNYGGKLENVRNFWQNFPHPVQFECLVIAVLSVVLLLLCGRVVVMNGILGAVSLICAFVNYTKVALNGDHFFPQDIMMLSDAKGLASFVGGGLPRWYFLGAAVILLWVIGFGVLDTRLPVSWKIRIPAALVLALCAWLPCSNTAKAEGLLSKFGMSLFDAALQSSNYAANGFVGAFTVNLMSFQVPEPEDYSRDVVESFLAGYEDEPARPGAEDFDVIVVLSESFFDARVLEGATFSKNPLENYDRVLDSDRCWSGMIYTTASGGGTVRPEFGVLTGMTWDYYASLATPYWYVDRDLPTYVTNYRDAGYATVALHPYEKKFYSRDLAYGHLGFDQFLGLEEIAELVDVDYKRDYATDATALRAIQYVLDSAAQPSLVFCITMQNHQPYAYIDPALVQVEVSSDRLSEPALSALQTYTQGLCDADKMLGDLCAWIDRRERPTVLAFFGDHLPTLGANTLAYNESGFFNASDGLDTEERMRMYSTPFLIYSNRDIGGGLFTRHTDNQVSDYNLLNSVAISTGFGRTAYMKLLEDFYHVTPMYNIRLDLECTEEIDRYASAMQYITYDWVFGRNYLARQRD